MGARPGERAYKKKKAQRKQTQPLIDLPLAEDPQLPQCVIKLESLNFDELEEACEELTFYATQSKLLPSLVAVGVPERLVKILCKPVLELGSMQATLSEGFSEKKCSGTLHAQIAAAEALRNFFTNSEDYEVADILGRSQFTLLNGENCTFSRVLHSFISGTWALIKEAHSYVPRDEHMMALWNSAEDDEAALKEHSEAQLSINYERLRASRAIKLYFTLLRYLEQLMLLLVVVVDGSEEVAASFSHPAIVSGLLRQLETFITESMKILEKESSVFDSNAALMVAEAHNGGSHSFFRQEATLLVNLASATSDVLHTLSSDNEQLATSMSATVEDETLGVTPAQISWLDSVVDGSNRLSWLSQLPELDPTCGVLTLQKEWMRYQLLQATLSLQGTLVNLFPSKANLLRVLPLTVQVLSSCKPFQQWQKALPLLEESCAIEEDVRSIIIQVVISRLRAGKAATSVLSNCVGYVCEHNAENEDDEVAFKNNTLSPILFELGAIHIFGEMLKDGLSMSNKGGEESVVDALRKHEQRALREVAKSNPEVTTIQFVILATEVTLWDLASSLLLMVPAASLGTPSSIWRAMINAVEERSELIRIAAEASNRALDTRLTLDQQLPSQALTNVATESPAARHLFWLQLKSLIQILWTLLRKQSSAHGGYLDCTNIVQAIPSDVDLLTRIAWEKDCPPGLCQACVAAVGYLCAAFHDPKAVQVAARFAAGVLLNAGGYSCSLIDLESKVIQTGFPSLARDRHVWLSRLQRADEFVTVRCEAANTLIDLFSDERYDDMVYLPLEVHRSLRSYMQQLHTYMSARDRVAKDLFKHYRFQAPPMGLSFWTEINENLEGFLQYKKQHVKGI